jgi:hypothetical protein
MEHILIITYYWPPAGGPGVQRWLKMSKYLPEYGLKPIILTVDKDQATYPLLDESLLKEVPTDMEVIRTKTKELFSLYKKTSGRKEVPFSGFANESDKPGPRQKISKWVRGNLLLPDPRKGWNRFAYRAAVSLIKERNIKYVVTTTPPHSTQLVGLKLKNHFPELKWIADLRDPWTDIYYYDQFYPSRIARKLDKQMERNVIEVADYVSVVSQDMKRMLSAKLDAKHEAKFLMVPNGFDPDDFSHNKVISTSGVFTIAYTGTITDSYRIDTFLDAVAGISESHRIKLVFVGKRDEILEKKIQQLPNSVKTELLPNVSHAESINYLLSADALLLAIPDILQNRGIVTGKIFEYLAAKKPIIGIGPVDGDAAEILSKTSSGVMYNYQDLESINTFLLDLLRGQVSFQYKGANYSRKLITKALAEKIIR